MNSLGLLCLTHHINLSYAPTSYLLQSLQNALMGKFSLTKTFVLNLAEFSYQTFV